MPPTKQPGIYAILLDIRTVKFGQSSDVPQRLTQHNSVLRGYGFTPVDTIIKPCDKPTDNERALFTRLRGAQYRRAAGSRETYNIGWDDAARMLDITVRRGAQGVKKNDPALDALEHDPRVPISGSLNNPVLPAYRQWGQLHVWCPRERTWHHHGYDSGMRVPHCVDWNHPNIPRYYTLVEVGPLTPDVERLARRR